MTTKTRNKRSKTEGYVPDALQFHPTPLECTVAFYRAEEPFMPKEIWEPACGDGAIAKWLAREGHKVAATDLIDRGYGQGGIDFLETKPASGMPRAIITNPPFKHADDFLIHALDVLRTNYLALFLPTIFWNAPTRIDLWERRRPAREYRLGWRPDIFGIGSPDQRCCYSWFVWDGHATETTTAILRRPV